MLLSEEGGLTTQDVGMYLWYFGVIALTIGDYWRIVISRDGLGKWMLPMFIAMHLPIIGFVFTFALSHPSLFTIFMQQSSPNSLDMALVLQLL
jgi:PAT family beta-lactamase induction signal transducer AmpG